MNLERFILRNKKKSIINVEEKYILNLVLYASNELKEIITSWLENEGWELDDFKTILNFAGVKTPIIVSDWNKKNDSFKCRTDQGTEVTITLCWGDLYDGFHSRIIVEDGDRTLTYRINTKHEQCNNTLKLKLEKESIIKNGKVLNYYYSGLCFDGILEVDETHMLKFEIHVPNIIDESAVLKNSEQIENYLFSLDNSVEVEQVYDTMMKYLEFSDNDILGCRKIQILYVQKVANKEKIVRQILKRNGITKKIY